MENGLMTIEKTGTETRAIFIDQDVLECARLNMRTKNRINKQQKEEEAKVRARKRNEKTARRILTDAVIGWAVAAAGSAGMISPAIWVPVAIISLCAACVRLGAWLGGAAKR